MVNVLEAGNGINGVGSIMDDYQDLAAEMTSAFEDQGKDAKVAINDITDDPAMQRMLDGYDTDGDGRLSFEEYSKAMAALDRKTRDLGSVQVMIAETVAKISEALASVAKFF